MMYCYRHYRTVIVFCKHEKLTLTIFVMKPLLQFHSGAITTYYKTDGHLVVCIVNRALFCALILSYNVLYCNEKIQQLDHNCKNGSDHTSSLSDM